MNGHRLSPRTALVRATWLLPPLGSAILAALATGGRFDARFWIITGSTAAAFLVVLAIALVRLRTTRYRLTGEAVEMSWRLFGRRERSVPLDRVRYADITAGPLHRVLGIAVLRIGTAGSGELVLDALPAAEARELRSRLSASGSGGIHSVLSTMDVRWLRYAPLTFWAFGGLGIAVGSLYRVLDSVGIEPWRLPLVRGAFEEFGKSALWLTVPLLILAVVLLGALGATAMYVENWWHFRLAWSDRDELSVRRGLFTTRSVTMERRRLRGAELAEPLLLRAGGGAMVRAVAGGLGDAEETRSRSRILPPAPRAESVSVAARVSGATPGTLSAPDLIAHPRAAFSRRLRRGLFFAVLPGTAAFAVAAVLFGPSWFHGAWIWSLASLPATWWLAADAHRSLGHAVEGHHLLIRSGTFSRDTVALDRDAVLAWTFTSSPFGRRAGLVGLTAAVAAGRHGYRIPDMAADEAIGFAEGAAPGILAEFLVWPEEPPSPQETAASQRPGAETSRVTGHVGQQAIGPTSRR
ncbi:PH domain-containing protein [Phytomonospora sp. NPDC050363]|uniref:PH domain-containing protein n=1 Tax=Phytomonospora sp. NPDC050363 TaxID=3155642 RepID=UPI0033D559C1